LIITRFKGAIPLQKQQEGKIAPVLLLFGKCILPDCATEDGYQGDNNNDFDGVETRHVCSNIMMNDNYRSPGKIALFAWIYVPGCFTAIPVCLCCTAH